MVKLNNINFRAIGIEKFDNQYCINYPLELNADSFFVEEIDEAGNVVYLEKENNYQNSGKNFIRFKLIKRNLSTLEAIKIIAKKLNISSKLFGYYGLKDKYATTSQLLSLPFNEQLLKKLLNLSMLNSDIKISDIHTSNEGCKLGKNVGNRFVVRFSIQHNESDLLKGINYLRSNGVRNYFNYQRFGRKSINLKASYALIQGYLGIALSFLKNIKIGSNQDYLKEIKKLDKRLRMLIFQSYQAYLFNKLLSRIELNSYKDIILPGYDLFNYKDVGYFDKIQQILSEEGICYKQLEIPSMPEIDMKCRFRKAILFPKEISLSKEGNQYELSFILERGEYAINVVSELFYNQIK